MVSVTESGLKLKEAGLHLGVVCDCWRCNKLPLPIESRSLAFCTRTESGRTYLSPPLPPLGDSLERFFDSYWFYLWPPPSFFRKILCIGYFDSWFLIWPPPPPPPSSSPFSSLEVLFLERLSDDWCLREQCARVRVVGVLVCERGNNLVAARCCCNYTGKR